MRVSRRMAIASVGGQYTNLFTYTGSYTYVNDGGKNWRIKLLTSGTFVPLRNVKVDLFAVGGGGGGRTGTGTARAAAGGGGYTKTLKDVQLVGGESYTVYVGTGGAKDASGKPSAVILDGTDVIRALGGKPATGWDKGGHGGSGGGGPSSSSGTSNASGGSDGGNGINGDGTGGTGQGTTTREFGEETGDLYAGGGSGKPGVWAGGEGGGGASNKAGTANTGGGGGANAAGGSGIIIIRNKR